MIGMTMTTTMITRTMIAAACRAEGGGKDWPVTKES
jgi:hypothetical protein